MPQATGSTSGRRLARDLRRIREARGVSVEDLHDETKIPLGLLEAFEDSALFDHPQFNRVYLRSFIRTYAQVLGIAPEVAIEALEEALEGRYHNQLAAEYLGEKIETPAGTPEPGRGEGARVGSAERSGPERVERSEERAAGAVPASEGPDGAAPGRKREPEGPPQRAAEAAAGGAAGVDWTAQSPPPGRRAAAAPGRAARPARGGVPPWIWIGAAVVVLAGITWLAVGLLGGSDTQPAQNETVADAVPAADTVEAAAPTGPLRDPSTIPTLGDTMDVRIIAAEGKLDPIRVTVDDDLRRPYWVEQGDSISFEPTQRIVIEELLDNIALKLEGELYPTDRRDPQNRIVITRDTAQAFFESLAQQPAPDTTAALPETE